MTNIINLNENMKNSTILNKKDENEDEKEKAMPPIEKILHLKKTI